MFDKRVGGWLDWADVQKARLEAVKLATATRGDVKLLRDAAALSLLSLIPPDRVVLIRKLRLGHTLKKAAGGGWRLDLSKQRDGHKTSSESLRELNPSAVPLYLTSASTSSHSDASVSACPQNSTARSPPSCPMSSRPSSTSTPPRSRWRT